MNNEKQINSIISSVNDEANRQAAAIREQADKFRKAELERAENEVLDEMYGHIAAESIDIKDEATKHVTKSALESQRELLKKREEFSNMVFDAVKNQLLDFTGTADYDGWLLAGLEAALAQVGADAELKILLCGKDLAKAEKLSAKTGRALTPVASNAIKIGGFLLEVSGKNTLIDNTLDLKLQDQREWFYANSGLAIN